MNLLDRVPFAVAIASDKLLKKRFESLTLAQQVVVKAFYGLPLVSEEEFRLWSIFQGGAEYDDLGYPTHVKEVPYSPKEYDTLNLYVGRRSGKTDAIMGTIVAYESTLGGHKRYVREGQEYKIPFIAQTSGDAQKNMNFIKLALLESDLLKGRLRPEDEQVATAIRFKDGLVIEPMPANKGVGRGHAIPVWIGDETAFWYTDPNAANPDFEVARAISHAQAQFPFAKTLLGTTPWAEQGIAFKNHKAGTEGRNLRCDICKAIKAPFCPHTLEDREEFEGILSIHASTAVMGALEKVLGGADAARKRLVRLRKRDREAFPRESLAQTLKSVSGWLAPANIERAIFPGRHQLDPQLGRGIHYVAAMDPAFRKDSFAFTIMHHDAKEGLIQDFLFYWSPEPGIPLNPDAVLTEMKAFLDAYDIQTVYSDQYQLEALQQLAIKKGFSIVGHDFTGVSKSKITGSFKMVLDQDRVRLLDHELQKDQLFKLQKQVLQSGQIRIAAPPGKHDDLAMVLMLASRIVMWLFTTLPAKQEHEPDPEHDHVKMGLDTINRRKREALAAAQDDD